jgi:hypothetical protein
VTILTYLESTGREKFDPSANLDSIWWSGGIAALIINLGARWKKETALNPRATLATLEQSSVSFPCQTLNHNISHPAHSLVTI